MKYRVDVELILLKRVIVEADDQESARENAIDLANSKGWDTEWDYDRTEVGSVVPTKQEADANG